MQRTTVVEGRATTLCLSDIQLPDGVALDLAGSKGVAPDGSLTFDPRPGRLSSGAAILLRSTGGHIWLDIIADTGVVKVRR